MEEQSNNADVGTVLLMLDNKCLPPCYCFETKSREVRSMSPEILDDVLEWASQFKPSPPGMMYMVGAPQELDEEVQKLLKDVAGSVICAPMQKSEQEKAGLPFFRTQMVVFPSLADFERDRGIVRGRSCVVHIGCEEISRWSSAIKVHPKKIAASRLRFRPRNLHLWDRSHLKAYKNQFIGIAALKCHLNASGVKVNWELSSPTRCPATRTLVTIGPDGLCYPCPTFYYAGQTNGLGSIKTLASDRLFLQSPEKTCRLCQSEHCDACLFWELGHATGEVAVCELPTGMDGDTSWGEIIWEKDLSGYMFEGFKSSSIEGITQDDNKSLWASEQVDDISLEDFVSALQSINQTARAVMKGTTEVSENLISQYDKLIETAPKASQMTSFSYDQLTKSLEEIHLKGGRATPEVEEGYDSLLSQYKRSGKSDKIPRKVFFFENVKEILLGLVELSEAVNKRQLRWKRTLPVGNGTSDAKEEDETGKLLLSEYEVMSIRQIYEIFLGWCFLYDGLTEELNYGFEVDREMIEAARREMTEAKAQMQRWFHQTGIQHNWEYRDGYEIAVDFESNLNVSSAQYQKKLYINPEEEHEDWTPIMKLDGIEKEVIERLTMSVEDSLTEVKECLIQHLADLDVERDLVVAVKTLGQCKLNMNRWYHGMAREHNWPKYLEWRINLEDWIIEGR